MRDNYSIKLNILKKLLFLLLFALSSGALLAQKNYTIRGFVYNSDNGEAESYVKVLLKPIVINQSSEINGALTDLDGFFNSTLCLPVITFLKSEALNTKTLPIH